MSKVQLTTTAEVRAQILQLIALEKLENDKDYTIKSYLEYLVGLAARGKFGEAGKLNIPIKVSRPHSVVVTIDGENASDKTYEEVMEAIKQGRDVVLETKTAPAAE